jgi:hypothetical protein
MKVLVDIPDYLSIFPRVPLLPDIRGNEVPPSENLVHDDLEVMPLVVVDADPDRAVLAQELAEKLEPRHDHGQPLRVLEVVVVMLEGRPGVVRRIDVDALHLAGEERQQRLQRLEVVALDQHVPGIAVPAAELRHLLEQPVGHAIRRDDVAVAGKPVEARHAFVLFLSFPVCGARAALARGFEAIDREMAVGSIAG